MITITYDHIINTTREQWSIGLGNGLAATAVRKARMENLGVAPSKEHGSAMRDLVRAVRCDHERDETETQGELA